MKRVLLFFLLVLITTSNVLSQQRRAIFGTVSGSGGPQSVASVSAKLVGNTVATDEQGKIYLLLSNLMIFC